MRYEYIINIIINKGDKIMPRFDGRGPFWGGGPGAGWGRGPCGYGRGWGWGYYPSYPSSPKEEKEILEDDVKIMEEDLKAAKARLNELKDQK